MTPDLKQIAMKALQDFRSGDEIFGDHPFEITFPKGYLAEKFREWVENQRDDGTSLKDALGSNRFFWSLARIAEIESGSATPTFDELLQWCGANNPDFCEPVAILTWPLEHDEEKLGWALIEHSGFVLAPDIELIGTFTELSELRQFVAENFEGWTNLKAPQNEIPNKEISDALNKEGEKKLKGFQDGALVFADFVFELKIPYRVDFHEWIAHIEDYLDVDPSELLDENRFETIKRFFPAMDKIRLQYLINDPKSITEDESLEWRRSLYENDQDGSDFLILVALETSDGEIGSAIICSYSDIPGGEHELIEVFSSLEEGEQYLSKYCF